MKIENKLKRILAQMQECNENIECIKKEKKCAMSSHIGRKNSLARLSKDEGIEIDKLFKQIEKLVDMVGNKQITQQECQALIKKSKIK